MISYIVLKCLKFQEIRNLRTNNRRYNCDIFSILYTLNDDFKCTIVAKKANIPLAVQRNKIRRQIKHIIRDLCKEYSINIHMMIITKSKYDCYVFSDLKEKITKFFKMIHKHDIITT